MDEMERCQTWNSKFLQLQFWTWLKKFPKKYAINFPALQITNLFKIRWYSIIVYRSRSDQVLSSGKFIRTSYTSNRDDIGQSENSRFANADVDSVRSLKNYHVARINRLIVDYAVVCLGSHSLCTRVDDTPNK